MLVIAEPEALPAGLPSRKGMLRHCGQSLDGVVVSFMVVYALALAFVG